MVFQRQDARILHPEGGCWGRGAGQRLRGRRLGQGQVGSHTSIPSIIAIPSITPIPSITCTPSLARRAMQAFEAAVPVLPSESLAQAASTRF